MAGKPSECLINFVMDGRLYGFVMPAESWDDAERRMRAIRLTGRVAGYPCYSGRLPSPLMYLALPLLGAWAALLNLVGWKGRE